MVTIYGCQLHGQEFRGHEALRQHENEEHDGMVITTFVREEDDGEARDATR